MYRTLILDDSNENCNDVFLDSDDVCSLSRSCPSTVWLVPEEKNENYFIKPNIQQSFGYLPFDDAKLRKRRESHNAVERRRRDHINDMIQKLSELVCANDKPTDDLSKANKGEILAKAVSYINELNRRHRIAIEHIKKIDPEWNGLH